MIVQANPTYLDHLPRPQKKNVLGKGPFFPYSIENTSNDLPTRIFYRVSLNKKKLP